MKAAPAFDRFEYESRLRAAKEKAVEAALPDLHSRRQEFTDAAVAQHAADVAAYEFECRRHGDFLTIFATRLDHEGRPSKFSTSINLLLVTELRLIEGVEPAAETDVSWNFQYERDGSSCTSWPMHLPRDGEVLVAWTHTYPASPGRSAYRVAPEADGHHSAVYGMGDNGLRKGTMPAPARDDEVRFIGIGSALLVPFGLGQFVLDKILSEMAPNQTPAPLDAEAGA